MKRLLLLALAIGALAILAAGPALAAEVEGTVKEVDSTGKIITMEDGTVLELSSSATVDRQALQPGAQVKASYDVQNGKNMISVIEVKSSATPGAASPPSSQPSDRPSTMPSTPPADKPATTR